VGGFSAISVVTLLEDFFIQYERAVGNPSNARVRQIVTRQILCVGEISAQVHLLNQFCGIMGEKAYRGEEIWDFE
jgi:hypothetical protein